jgi:hypothetical protein
VCAANFWSLKTWLWSPTVLTRLIWPLENFFLLPRMKLKLKGRH